MNTLQIILLILSGIAVFIIGLIIFKIKEKYSNRKKLEEEMFKMYRYKHMNKD